MFHGLSAETAMMTSSADVIWRRSGNKRLEDHGNHCCYLARFQCDRMEALGRVELPTNGLGNRCSIHLSYRAVSRTHWRYSTCRKLNDLYLRCFYRTALEQLFHPLHSRLCRFRRVLHILGRRCAEI